MEPAEALRLKAGPDGSEAFVGEASSASEASASDKDLKPPHRPARSNRGWSGSAAQADQPGRAPGSNEGCLGKEQ